MFRENVWKEANTLVKVAFCSSGITFQGHNKILSEIMKFFLFFFSQFQWFFCFLWRNLDRAVKTEFWVFRWFFRKKFSSEMLLVRIHFRSLTKKFRTLFQKHSNVVVRISFYASRDIVWGKKISYKGARSLGIILQFSVDNFWHGQQKINSFLQRIYRKRTFSKGRFFVFGKFDLRSGNPQDLRRNFRQSW